MPRNPFKDSTALVTGGAGGLGRALGRALAVRGARVVLADLRGDDVEALAEAWTAEGWRVQGVSLDVTDPEAFSARVQHIIDTHGRLDFLFNNAGIGITGEVRDMDLDAWNRVLDVNLRGVIHGIAATYPHMIRQGDGHIANTACVAGLVPFPMTAAYCASKHAVVALSASLRGEAADLGVRVSVICPGTIDTGMFEAIEYIRTDKDAIVHGIRPTLMPVERCAEAILRGITKNRAIIPVSLHARVVWWLYRLMPVPFLALARRGFGLFRKKLRTEQ